MIVRPFRDERGRPMVETCCEECGQTVELRADITPDANPSGQIMPKITKQGWALIKRRLYCPECNAARKAAPLAEEDMATKAKAAPVAGAADTGPREPTREQKREIMAMLDVAYDTKAGRYKGEDTDKMVAEALGGGIMPGWVEAIREEFFGPAGGNEEIWKLEADIALKFDAIDAALAALRERQGKDADAIRDFVASRGDLSVLKSRLEAIKAAVGPKAGML